MEEGSYKVCGYYKRFCCCCMCVCGGGGVFMSMLGLLCMHTKFAFGWCASGYENVGIILII